MVLQGLRRRQDARRLVQADAEGLIRDHGAPRSTLGHSRQVALTVARMAGKRGGVDTTTRMAERATNEMTCRRAIWPPFCWTPPCPHCTCRPPNLSSRPAIRRDDVAVALAWPARAPKTVEDASLLLLFDVGLRLGVVVSIVRIKRG
jgi:hypothetical protein